MVNAGLTALNAGIRNKVPCVVLTSSGGSTNAPGASPDAIKNEIDSWSDPDLQKQNNRFSPCAKTMMEISALKQVGRNQ